MESKISWVDVLKVLPSSEKDYIYNIITLAKLLYFNRELNNTLFVEVRRALDICVNNGWAEAKLVGETPEGKESGYRMRRTSLGDEVAKRLESGEVMI